MSQRADGDRSFLEPGRAARNAIERPGSATPAGCPACRGRRLTARRILPDLTTHRCASCGLIVGEIERVGPAIPEFALVEQEAYLRSVGASRTRQAAQILRHLIRHVPHGVSILDIGCSFGFFLQEARRAGFDVRGVEPDPQAYGYASRVLGEGVVHLGVLDGDTATPRSADVVATLDVIEHLPLEEHDTFAERITSVLRPGGVWVIKVPSTEGLYYKLSDLMVRAYPPVGASLMRRLWQTRYEYPHLMYFSLESLSAWLERFGFDVISHRYLPEIPTGTIVDRLTTDGDIGKAKAYLAAPAVMSVTLIDRFRGRSDALVVYARPRERR
jgi:SAM-dependent methyltransferase